ncbi:MAG TPA: TonB family protein [Gemmatimonadaceae bacterium]|nr:TonB family protein [Gemmatimonadaceae bacterium]
MARDIFDEVAHPSVRVGSRAWYVLPVSILAHAIVAVIVIVVPLMAADVLPRPSSMITFMMSTPVVPSVPPPPPSGGQSRQTPTPAQAIADPAPSEAPWTIEPEPTGGAVPGSSEPGVPGGLPGGEATSILGNLPEVPPAPALTATKPVRTGGQIRNPAKTRDVRPAYPAIAVASRVEGRVMIEAIIGVDGRVKHAKILRSIPLLDQSALAAVMQWQFTPTLLNGVPVPVIMTVTVNFTLQ